MRLESGAKVGGAPHRGLEYRYSQAGSSFLVLGGSMGKCDGLPSYDFVFDDGETFDFDADRVYDDGLGFGLTYGQLLGQNWRTSLGFDYVRNKVKNPIMQESGIYQYTIAFADDLTCLP